MSSNPDFIEYACDVIEGTGTVRCRKMFGDYMIYVDDKPILLVCDNTVYVKILPCVETLLAATEKGRPYPGAKEHYILDVDNPGLAAAVVRALLPVTAVPKPKKKKAPDRGGA